MRTVPVLVAYDVIAGSQLEDPRLGAVATYHLGFSEAADAGPADPLASRFAVRAESLGDGTPRRGGWAGPGRERPLRWSTLLFGDGWAATWSAPRPVIGDVGLLGTLSADYGMTRTWIRGRIVRMRSVTETIDVEHPDPLRRRPIPGCQVLQDISVVPRGAPGEVQPTPRPDQSHLGVLLDLDLEDVPGDETGGVLLDD